ncbi:MAG: prepilin-type N-terminal cleavage/methylation domain-containing protein [Burkholderiales bacterium]
MRRHGFTLVELIVVIVIVGIVALIAAPRFFAQTAFDAARFQDTAISAIRYGQKVAQAQHTVVYVLVSAGSVALCYDTGCASPVKSPADNSAFVVAAPSGISISAASFSFTPLGQPATAAATPVPLTATSTLTISGDSIPRQIVVEQETGYVHK